MTFENPLQKLTAIDPLVGRPNQNQACSPLSGLLPLHLPFILLSAWNFVYASPFHMEWYAAISWYEGNGGEIPFCF